MNGKLITYFLAQNKELKPLYEKVLIKIGKGQFINYFRQLLKPYYLNFDKNSGINLE